MDQIMFTAEELHKATEGMPEKQVKEGLLLTDLNRRERRQFLKERRRRMKDRDRLGAN